jgi:hypothetical protein
MISNAFLYPDNAIFLDSSILSFTQIILLANSVAKAACKYSTFVIKLNPDRDSVSQINTLPNNYAHFYLFLHDLGMK